MALKFIGLCGKKNHGKSTIRDQLMTLIARAEPLSFASPLKHACQSLFGGTCEHWYGSKKEEILDPWYLSPREIMQAVGTDLFRNTFDKKFWVKSFGVQVARMIDYNREIEDGVDKVILVDDIRFDNEAELIRSYGGKIYKIVRLGVEDTGDKHESELGVSDCYIEATLEAQDIETLNMNAEYIVKDSGLCSTTTP